MTSTVVGSEAGASGEHKGVALKSKILDVKVLNDQGQTLID
ncbi:hypothetical protein [Streptomyces sp. NPDC052721]